MSLITDILRSHVISNMTPPFKSSPLFVLLGFEEDRLIRLWVDIYLIIIFHGPILSLTFIFLIRQMKNNWCPLRLIRLHILLSIHQWPHKNSIADSKIYIRSIDCLDTSRHLCHGIQLLLPPSPPTSISITSTRKLYFANLCQHLYTISAKVSSFSVWKTRSMLTRGEVPHGVEQEAAAPHPARVRRYHQLCVVREVGPRHGPIYLSIYLFFFVG